MKERVISLSDRGRALEWLSLGFGLWLIAGLVFALLVVDAPDPTGSRALASGAAHLVAGAAVATGLVFLVRSGPSAWPLVALAGLAVAAGAQVLRVPWVVGSAAQLVLIASALQAVRDLASAEGKMLPISIVGVAVGAEIVRLVVLGTAGARHDNVLPWARAGMVAVVSTVSVGFLLVAVREASAVVRARIWAGEPGVTSPARAADWSSSTWCQSRAPSSPRGW